MNDNFILRLLNVKNLAISNISLINLLHTNKNIDDQCFISIVKLILFRYEDAVTGLHSLFEDDDSHQDESTSNKDDSEDLNNLIEKILLFPKRKSN